MITFEALDVILRVQNLPGFTARMRAGAREVSRIGTAAVDANKKASTAIYAAARKATLGLTAMAAVATATGYKQSVEFEKQLTLVHTQAGATRAEMMAFKEPLLEMAKALPQGPVELAKGLYHIKSIGIPAAQAMDALKVAAQGAMVGNADLEQTTSALGAAWLAGIKGANGFRNTMAIMNATVGAGNMRMDELVTALGTGVLPTAKLAGLGIQDVMAALALLKDEGYGAYGAMAQFATALHFFTSPTKKATDAFKKLGLSQLDLADMMRKRGMVATLGLLRDRLKLTGEQMARLSSKNWAPETQQEKLLGAILPGGRGRVFRVLLNQVDRYQMKIDQINRTSKNFAGAIASTQATAANRLHTAWSSVQVDLIRLGDTVKGPATDVLVSLMGILQKFIGVIIFLIHHIGTLIAIFTPLIAAWLTYKGVIIATALAMRAWAAIQFILYVMELIRVLGLATTAMLLFDAATAANPIGLIALAIAAVVAAIVIMIMNWDKVKAAINRVVDFILKHKALIAAVPIVGPLIVAAAAIIKHWGEIKDAIVNTIGAIRNAISSAAHIKMPWWAKVAAGAAPGIGPLMGGYNLGKKLLGGYTGGMVTSGGAINVGEHGKETVILPGGSRVFPHQPAGFRPMPGGAASAAGGDVIELHVHSYLDGKEVSENVSRHMANKKARR